LALADSNHLQFFANASSSGSSSGPAAPILKEFVDRDVTTLL